MAWWFQKQGPRRSHPEVELDVVLDTSAVDEFEPPQAESLFDADEYVTEFEQAEAESEAEVEDAPEGEAASVPESEPAPEAPAEPEPEPAPEPDATPEPEPEPELNLEPEPVPVVRTHVRRRAHGRSGRRAAKTASLEVAAPEPESATAITEPDSGAPAPARGASDRTGRVTSRMAAIGTRVLAVLLVIVLLLGGLFGLVLGINWIARPRPAATGAVAALPDEDNLLVIGVSDGVAVGFVALKAERSTKKVLGIAIPDGAFVEVPGQGFERVGASYNGGPQVSEDAISNFFGVPFSRHVVVDGTTYQEFLRTQDAAALMASVTATDLSADERAAFTSYFAGVATTDVWIVPLPVKPVAVGDQRYFEPQKKEIADLLQQWWGVQPGQAAATPRVIVYNGVGTPGLAGVAAQQLIRAGFRIVDSGNAGNFEYLTTEIHLFHGTQAEAEGVRASLGVGEIIIESAPQDLADMIVIIGADYVPPADDTSTIPTEGVQ